MLIKDRIYSCHIELWLSINWAPEAIWHCRLSALRKLPRMCKNTRDVWRGTLQLCAADVEILMAWWSDVAAERHSGIMDSIAFVPLVPPNLRQTRFLSHSYILFHMLAWRPGGSVFGYRWILKYWLRTVTYRRRSSKPNGSTLVGCDYYIWWSTQK